MDLEAAKREYIRSTIEADSSPLTKSGVRRNNRAADRSLQALKKIRDEAPDNGESFFRELLLHEDPAVRLSGAVQLIRIDESAAIEMLEKISTEPSRYNDRLDAPFTAYMLLKRWRDGSWP